MKTKFIPTVTPLILLSLFLICNAPSVTKAQCLGLKSIDDLETQTGTKVTKVCPNPNIVAKINSEAMFLREVFGVNPNIFFMDDKDSPNAFAVPIDTLDGYYKTVAFGETLVWSHHLKEGYKNVALSVIMAHEWAHILQFKLNPNLPSKGKSRELHADYMAGYYISRKQVASSVGWVSWPDVQACAKDLFDIGDYSFNSPSHHGTPEERMTAFNAGYTLALDKMNKGEIESPSDLSAQKAFAAGVNYVKALK